MTWTQPPTIWNPLRMLTLVFTNTIIARVCVLFMCTAEHTHMLLWCPLKNRTLLRQVVAVIILLVMTGIPLCCRSLFSLSVCLFFASSNHLNQQLALTLLQLFYLQAAGKPLSQVLNHHLVSCFPSRIFPLSDRLSIEQWDHG